MKMKIFSTILLFCFLQSSFVLTDDKPAYIIYDSKGEKVDYSEMLKQLKKTDIAFFGELHNNPIAHWLQLEVTKDLYEAKKSDLVLGAEMFETDNQLILDEYLSDLISQRSFKQEARLWTNYDTDYEPLVEFAKKNKINFIATNIPRRYASVVFKKGLEYLDSLPATAKQYIAPLPITVDLELKSYKSLLETMGGHSGDNTNFPKAQAIKDATMAHFILKNWKKGQLFLHYNGTFHTDIYEGINWYVKQENKKAKITTISTVEQEDIKSLLEENKGKGDFIICIPTSMTKTH
jgi:uncharacterized iron-regulated protein